MIMKILVMNRITILLFSLILSVSNINAQVKGVEGKNGKWSLVNDSGEMIGSTAYEMMGNGDGTFSEGLLSVTLNKKSGYIDTTGKVVIPLKYDGCDKFNSGTATVWIGDFCGLVDKTGKIIIPVKYSLVDDTQDKAIVQVSLYNKTTERPKYGLFTRSGKELLPVSYDEIGYIINGITMLKQSKLYGYYFTDTKVIIPCKFDDARNFSEEFAAVAINKKWGYIDLSGKIVIPLEYDDARSLDNGHADVRKNGVSSIISKQLKTTINNGGKEEFELVTANQKRMSVPSIEREVIPGVFTMEVPTSLNQQGGDLYGHISIYSDGSTFLYFKKDDNKTAISYLEAMLQFKQWKTSVGFIENGLINYSSPSKIAFVGFYGLQPDPLNKSDYTSEAYIFFNKPGESIDCWIIHYRLGRENLRRIEDDIEGFLKTIKLK
jgi:hypothetical protein